MNRDLVDTLCVAGNINAECYLTEILAGLWNFQLRIRSNYFEWLALMGQHSTSMFHKNRKYFNELNS
jgi:hypothetical protein